MAYPTDGTIGATLNLTHTTAQFALGTRVMATDNQVWVYVKCALAMAIYDFGTIDSDFNVRCMYKANVDLGHTICVTQIALAVDDYGWVAINGMNLLGNVTASAMPGQFTATCSTTGRITTSGTSQTELQGITIKTTAGLTATSTLILMNSPTADL